MRSFLSILLAVMFVFVVGTASAVVETVTLDAGTIPAGVVCNQQWVEGNVILAFVPQTPDDCSGGGPCFFGVGGFDPDGVDLFPARLEGDLTLIPGVVTSAAADVTDFCGINCTRLLFYNGAALVATVGNLTPGMPETLTLNAGGNPVDRVAVSSCEAGLTEIRITFDPTVPVEEGTWGAIKALYK